MSVVEYVKPTKHDKDLNRSLIENQGFSEKLTMVGDFICRFVKNGYIADAHLSLTTIQQMILNHQLRPDDLVKSAGDENYTAFYNRPDLIPFRKLREDMIAAYQIYDEEQAVRRCIQILDFDRAQSCPERIDALLVKAMILHRRDPKQAEQSYIECLNYADADLIPVVLNNLGVINLELDRVTQAIRYLEQATIKDTDCMAAQMNLALAYRRMNDARKRSQSDETDYGKLASEKEIDIFKKVEANPCLLDQLLEDRNFPSISEALLLYRDDMPSAFGVAKEHSELRLLANKYLELGLEAMAQKQYDEAILIFKIAVATDKSVEFEAQRHIDLAEDKTRLIKATEQQEYINEVMKEVDEYLRTGSVAKAIEAAANLQATITDQEQRRQIGIIIDRLRKEKAQKYFEEGCALQTKGKLEEALQLFRESVRLHGHFQTAIDIRVATIEAYKIWEEFNQAIRESDFGKALHIASRMRALNQYEPFAQDAESMEQEIKREISGTFKQGLERLQRGDAELARAEFLKARISNPDGTFTIDEIFKLLQIFEEEPMLHNTIAFLIQGNLDQSLIALRMASSGIEHSQHCNQMKDMIIHEVILKDPQFVKRRLDRAKQLLEQKRWDEARTELSDARMVEPTNFTIERLAEEIWYKESLENADRITASGDYSKATQLYEQILAKRTGDQTALHDKAFCELRCSKLSIDDQERAMGLFKESSQALRQGDYLNGIVFARNALSLYPSFPSTLEVRNRVLLKVQEAIKGAKSKVTAEPEAVLKSMADLEQLANACGDDLSDDARRDLGSIQEILKQWRQPAPKTSIRSRINHFLTSVWKQPFKLLSR